MLSNVKRLEIARLSQTLASKGLQQALTNLTDVNVLKAAATEAQEWVARSIALVKTAPDNTWTTDEEIASAILKEVEARGYDISLRESYEGNGIPWGVSNN